MKVDANELEIQQGYKSQTPQQSLENGLLLLQLLKVQEELERYYLKYQELQLKYQALEQVQKKTSHDKGFDKESGAHISDQSARQSSVYRPFENVLRKIYLSARQYTVFRPFVNVLRKIYLSARKSSLLRLFVNVLRKIKGNA
jgi:hypothetical protein